MLTLLIFLAVLSVLVLVHEAGHYLVARACGVRADEFGYGFPPRLIGFVKEKGRWRRVRRGEHTAENTIWSINWLPLGGFVRLKGEQGEAGEDQDSFQSKSAWKRLLILGAGVGMNWLLAIVIFSVAFSIGVPTELENLSAAARIRDTAVRVTEVLPGSSAEKAGLLPGETVREINAVPVTDAAQARETLASVDPQASLRLTIGDEKTDATRTVETSLSFVEALGTVSYPVPLAVVEGVRVTASYTWMVVVGFYTLLKDLVSGLKPSADISGPVGIAVLTGRIAEQGAWSLMHFTAILSINLAVINFLPIPALDGGRVLFIVIETLRRRKVKLSLEAAVHRIGFALLLLLIALVTLQDLRRYGGAILHGIGRAVGLTS
jgi:regulator of sigma E protease